MSNPNRISRQQQGAEGSDAKAGRTDSVRAWSDNTWWGKQLPRPMDAQSAAGAGELPRVVLAPAVRMKDQAVLMRRTARARVKHTHPPTYEVRVTARPIITGEQAASCYFRTKVDHPHRKALIQIVAEFRAAGTGVGVCTNATMVLTGSGIGRKRRCTRPTIRVASYLVVSGDPSGGQPVAGRLWTV